MFNGKQIAAGVLAVGAAVTIFAAGARGQNSKGDARGASDGDSAAPSRVEFSRLQTEVREQKQLILDMLQAEQQRYEMLLKIIRAQGGGASMDSLPPMPTFGASAPAAPAEKAERGHGSAAIVEAAKRTAPLEGKIEMTGGGRSGDVYVYVENVKSAHAKGKSIEIKQENKQFSPRLAVVQVGTNVVFPNFDAIYHNVFSTSPHNSFDLGSYRAGDKPRTVTLTTPGVVEIFCNMHQKMSADVLVVPSPLYTKARADGTFRIDNVPVGMRKVVAWSPGTKTAQQRVEVTTAGGQVMFALEREDARAHANKLGQAYGSYRD
ncbi:MAG TPA: carboxypeptidase regulatory-like domain-containing protein [Polyangia bacterium]|jgi:plastocyanin